MRWACRACGCLYAAGAPCCPQCRATAHDEVHDEPDEEDEVPKIDRTGLATIGHATYGHVSAILPDGVRISGSADAPDPASSGPETEPPPLRAPKSEWADHAVSQGVPAEDVEGMTKAEIVEQVNGASSATPEDAAGDAETPAPASAEPAPSPAKPAPAPKKAPGGG